MIRFPTLSFYVCISLLTYILAAKVQQFNPQKLEKSIANNEFTLVYFFSSQCGYCQTFTPKYQQAAKIYKNESIVFGKLDGPAYPQLAEKYKINSYPSIALFFKGIDFPIFYTKQRETQTLLNFVKFATKPIQTTIGKGEYKKLKQDVRNQGIFYRGPQEAQQLKIVSALSLSENYRPFLRINQTQNQKPSLEIFGEKYNRFDFHQLLQVIRAKFARLFAIQEESWIRIHEKKHPGIVFVDTQKNQETTQLLQKLARQLPQIVFMRIDPSQEQYQSALDALGIEDEQSIIGVFKSADALFKANKPYTQESLKQFIGGFLNLTLPVHRKSEKQGDKYKLTRNNYEEKINEPKDILIFLYKEQDKVKRKLLELFKYLTIKLKQNKNLSILRCNLSKNEIEEKIGFAPKFTPSVFFLRNRMKDYPLHFTSGKISPENIIEFIMENTTFDWDDNWSNFDQL